MPPYSARGEENRAKRHRAVLIGVEHYTGNRNDLPAVAANLRLMRHALTADGTGVLAPEDIVVVAGEGNPAGDGTPVAGDPGGVNPLRVQAALSAARDEVTGLLVVYFAGHGIVRPDGSDLHLMFTGSRLSGDRHHPFVDMLSWRDIMLGLRNARADWVVVILDCCFAGNALQAFAPASEQNFALLTAAEPGVEIPPGDPETGTEFTAALHRLLTGGTDDGEPMTFTRLVTGIRNEMAPLKAVDGHRWKPDERRHGDDVVLALARTRDPGTESRTGTEPGSEANTGTNPGSEAGAGTDPGAEADTRTNPGSEAGAGEEPGAEAPPRRRWWAAVPGALRRLLSPPRRRLTPTTGLAVVASLALAGAGAWYLLAPGAGGTCATPLELRVLTDPDIRATVQKAADAYPQQGRKGRRDCRAVNLTVYDAKATDAVAAFRSSSLWQEPPAACPASGDCPQPQRDVGAQPDIWIPAAGSTWRRATDRTEGGGAAASAAADGTGGQGTADPGSSTVTLEPLGSVAFTPMVLAVPYTMPLTASLQTGAPLGTIIAALRAAQKDPVEILRPDPEGTDGALLSTKALYAAPETGSPSSLEQTMAQELRPMPPTAWELMCALADGSRNSLESRSAVLIPEQTLALFNLSPAHAARPDCATDVLHLRTAQYPSDIPMLDLPFLRVTWPGADRDAEAREAAVTDFRDWLVRDPEAQAYFTDDGFRGVDAHGRPAPPADNSLLRTGVNESAVREEIPATEYGGTGAVTSASLTTTLRRYRSALGPGKVLYLLDNSPSMADKRVWDGPGRAKELVTRSMSSLSTRDAYGVWSMAVAEEKKATDTVPVGHHGRADAAEATAAVTIADHHARVAESLRDAFAALRGGGSDADQPRLLVLVSDGEDSGEIGKKERDALLAEARDTPLVRVVAVSLRNGGCAPGRFDEQLAVAGGGRCLDPADDIATALTAEVAKAGTGDAE
ncbi:caspase family protein [Streptomyces griseus]|uniref:caspase family protein n=1 Tax=Streptomyces griseus TaxID=1911 RepID=UPI0008400644|nr:substrate-binding domain-containing protein [Streptomyces griseus]